MTIKRILRAAAADAIRHYLWQPTAPGPLGGRPWTMGRELRIFDQLCKHMDPLELIGAIAHVRALAGTEGPARLTWLTHRQRGQALLSRCVAAFHASQPTQAPPGPPRGGGFARVSVELPPPNLSDVRREIFDGIKTRRWE